MINFLIVVDDADIQLGDYFVRSYFDFFDTLIKITGHVEKILESLNCSYNSLLNEINKLNNKPFIFVSFSHGNENELIYDNDILVGDENVGMFKGCLFYTAACLTGVHLGQNLIENGCSSFVGYIDEVLILPKYENNFFECENHALKIFCLEDKTIKESYDLMIKKYDEIIDNLLMSANIEDTIAASILVGNKDLLTLLGNTELKITDLEVN